MLLINVSDLDTVYSYCCFLFSNFSFVSLSVDKYSIITSLR